jgi:hypothetical protein
MQGTAWQNSGGNPHGVVKLCYNAEGRQKRLDILQGKAAVSLNCFNSDFR